MDGFLDKILIGRHKIFVNFGINNGVSKGSKGFLFVKGGVPKNYSTTTLYGTYWL